MATAFNLSDKVPGNQPKLELFITGLFVMIGLVLLWIGGKVFRYGRR